MSKRPRNVEINDPDDFSTSERLKQIYQARQELREIRREAATHRQDMPKKALAYYRTGVESYFMELDTLFQRNDEGRKLWEEKYFGTVTLGPPPLPELKYHQMDLRSQPEPIEYHICGLETLFEVGVSITEEFEIESEHELKDTQTETVTLSQPISWQILNKMVSEANQYVADLGIGLEIDETDEWEI
jgi:hypothetical protein